MKDIENSKKESPMLGLTGMGGGVASLMWAGAGETLYRIFVWGNNSSPQSARLGLNNATDRSSPVLLGGAGNETHIKASIRVKHIIERQLGL